MRLAYLWQAELQIMLPKPTHNTNGTEGPGCLGCPMYGDGEGFCPDELVDGAAVMVLGQGPGEEEEAEGIPFTGRTGQRMNKRFLPLAGLERGENVSVGNVIKCRWGVNRFFREGGNPTALTKTNDLPPEPTLGQAVRHCTAAHLHIPDSVRLVIAQGQPAWEACGGPGSIHAWRGYLSPDGCYLHGSGVISQGTDIADVAGPLRNLYEEGSPSVLGTVHIAHLNKEPWLTVPAMHDWQRAGEYLAGTWPVPFPEITEVGRCEPWRWLKFFEYCHVAKTPVVIDTEFHDSGLIWLIGLYNEQYNQVIQLHWIDPSVDSQSKAIFVESLRELIGECPVILQNALADVRAMRTTWKFSWEDFHHIDDTMQAHAVLYVEFDHDLGFLDSCYGRHHRVKHLFKQNPTLYNAGDCWTPAYAMSGLQKELDRDADSQRVYKDRLELLPIIDESMTRGIRINKEAVKDGITKYQARRDAAEAVGQAYCGYPINLSSNDQVGYWLYEVEGLPTQRKRGKRGEAAVEASVDKDAVGKLRGSFLGFDPEEEPTEANLDRRIRLGGHPLLEARFVNQSARQNLSHYLYPLVERDGEIVDRVYHSIAIHTQNNARFSYTDPPLAQTPDDLRAIYEPDPDWPWLHWDMDQIELRIVAATARDLPLLGAFAEGLDVHLIAMCEVFGLPKPPVLQDPIHAPENLAWLRYHRWLTCDHKVEICGKNDIRRTFGKNFQYRECFQKDASPENAMNMPAARALGLTLADMVRADVYWKAAHPAIVAWQRRLIDEGKRTRETRDWYGVLRRYTDHLDNIASQILDHPSQAGCQTIMTLQLLEFKRRFKDAVYFVYGMHDSTNMAIWRPRWNEIAPQVKEIVEQPRNIFGLSIPFPASFKSRGIEIDRKTLLAV